MELQPLSLKVVGREGKASSFSRFFAGKICRDAKKRAAVDRATAGGGKNSAERLASEDFLDETRLDRLDRNPDAFGAAAGELHLDALQVRAELALRDAGDVRADAAAFFALTFAVDDIALDGTFASDGADSGHGWNGLKGSRVKGGDEAKQGEFCRRGKRGG